MINEPPPFKCPNIWIPIIISIKGRGCINQGSTLGYRERKQKSKLPFRVQGMEKKEQGNYSILRGYDYSYMCIVLGL